ncbi:MAG: hypothetical protein J6R79_00080 [Bacteroidaceae bacterium]|nr:hypothetical protein [Bacteroidaceae bacterium]
MTILCIHRAKRFSPKSEQRDEQIMQTVCHELKNKGHHIISCDEDDLEEFVKECSFEAVVSMARSIKAIQLLKTIYERGIKVFNKPSEMQLSRTVLLKWFMEHGIPMPQTQIVTCYTATTVPYPFWVKQGGTGAQSCNDVMYVASPYDIGKIDFRESEYAIVAHTQGDLIKFYGVAETEFFFYYYPTEHPNSFSKFGHEAINGIPRKTPFSLSELKNIANKAAQISGWTIYGGDAIITPQGEIHLIDFNDFPSFSTCYQEAARAIARRV